MLYPRHTVRAATQLLAITIVLAGLATGPANGAEKAAGQQPFGVRTTGGALAYEGSARRRTAAADTPSLGSAVTASPRRRNPPRAYTPNAGKRPAKDVVRDEHGNAAGAEYDLAHDGAFTGKKIAVLQMYNGEDEPAGIEPFDFAAPTAALQEKGFKVKRWTEMPSATELRRVLRTSSQLWVISGRHPSRLTEDHHLAIASFFDSGHGLYLWGDNEPFVVEANEIGERMFGARLEGNYEADQHLAPEGAKHLPNPGIQRHLVTTGLERLYEGVTTSTIVQRPFSFAIQPLLRGSDGALVAGVHESGGRAIMDGGYTRLFLKWDTAGTSRYVKNAAAWLANAERFDR